MKLAEEAVSLLKEKGLTVATAESCTGGMVAASIVNVSGASACFYGGFVTYANEAKESMIHVSHETLLAHGAVSEETAREMVEGTLKATGTDFAISTTGIAGPTGGTKEKPVGLVYIAVGNRDEVTVLENHFKGDRDAVRQATVDTALGLLLKQLKIK